MKAWLLFQHGLQRVLLDMTFIFAEIMIPILSQERL
nr:MAG TPA: hypothetical protein [Caudoviricetes sp.]